MTTSTISGDSIRLDYRYKTLDKDAVAKMSTIGSVTVSNQASLQMTSTAPPIEFDGDGITLHFDAPKSFKGRTAEHFFVNTTKKFPGTFELAGGMIDIPPGQLITYGNLFYVNLEGIDVPAHTSLRFQLTDTPQRLTTQPMDVHPFKLTPGPAGLVEFRDDYIKITLSGQASCEVTNLVSFSWGNISFRIREWNKRIPSFTTSAGTFEIVGIDKSDGSYTFDTPYSGPFEITVFWAPGDFELFCSFSSFMVAT